MGVKGDWPDRRVAVVAGRRYGVIGRARRQAEVRGMRLDAAILSDRTRSDLERDFLALCRRSSLPMPEVNVPIGRWTVDFAWPQRRLVVETDSFRYHQGKIAFEDDRERDLPLRELGYDVLRLSERHLSTDRDRVVEQLRELLGGTEP